MARPKIPAQAVPAQLRPRPAPDAFESTLPSGLVARWRMPDVFSILAFDGIVPDPLTASVIKLLTEERSYTPENDPLKLRNDAASIRGMYGLAAAMLEHPKLDVRLEYGEGETLGRREIAYTDVCALYWQFRVTSRQPAVAPAVPDDARGAADAAPDR